MQKLKNVKGAFLHCILYAQGYVHLLSTFNLKVMLKSFYQIYYKELAKLLKTGSLCCIPRTHINYLTFFVGPFVFGSIPTYILSFIGRLYFTQNLTFFFSVYSVFYYLEVKNLIKL